MNFKAASRYLNQLVKLKYQKDNQKNKLLKDVCQHLNEKALKKFLSEEEYKQTNLKKIKDLHQNQHDKEIQDIKFNYRY
jgi:hypothetical protein